MLISAGFTETPGADKTSSADSRLNASTNISTNGVSIDHDIKNVTIARGTFMSCSNMP